MATFIGLGLLCGIGGQGLRILVALHKAWCTEGHTITYWTARRIIVTLAVGAAAGVLATYFISWGEAIEPGEVVAYIAAGYAGTDFIEGIMTRRLPKSTAEGGT